jgi:hypothetical protein
MAAFSTATLSMSLQAETFEKPAPSKVRPHAANSAPARTYDFPAPKSGVADQQPGQSQGGGKPRAPLGYGQGGSDGQGPQERPDGQTINNPHQGSQDRKNNPVPEQTSPADPGSVTSDSSAGSSPEPGTPFPPIGGVSAGGQGGGGQPPQMPQFQQIPSFPTAQIPGPISEQNLSALLGGATSQMGETLDASRLTTLTDALGKQMSDLQNTFIGIMQTNTQTAVQGLQNSMNATGLQLTGAAQSSFASQVGSASSFAGSPRTNTFGQSGTNSMQPRSNIPTSDSSATPRSPASTPSGQRGRLFTSP